MLETLSAVLRQILEAPTAKPAGDARRGATRYPVRARVTARLATADGRPQGERLNVWLRDISSAGLGLIHTASLRAGQQMLVYIPDLEDLSPLACVVRRCERAAADVYVVGVTFVDARSRNGAEAPGAATLSAGQLARVGAQASARAEVSVAEPGGAAAAAANHVRRAAGTSPTPTALVALDRTYAWVNAAFADLLGLRADDLTGKPVDQLTYLDDAHLDEALAQRLFAGSLASYQSTKRYHHHNRTAVSITLTTSLLRDVAGRPLFLLSTAEPPPRPAVAPAPPAVTASPATPASPAVTATDEAERIRRAMFD